MGFDPDAYLAETSTQGSSGFDPDTYLKETEPKSVSGFAKNAMEDVKQTALSLGSLGKGLLTNPIDTTINTVSNLPKAVINEGKRIGAGELLTGHPINALEKFGNAAYEKPLTTALDVLPAAGAAGKFLGIGEEAIKGADVASEAAQVGEGAGKGAEMGDVSRMAAEPQAASEAVSGSVPTGSSFQDTVSNLKNKIPGEVKQPLQQVGDYLSNKYEQVTGKRGGWGNTVADYLGQHSQNVALKELGAAPGQIRKIGIDKARNLADYALENDLVGPKIGTIGREQIIPQRLEEAGGAVGAFRKMASDRGAVHNIDDLVKQVRSNLDQKYLTGGLNSSDKGLYAKSLAELKKAGPRAEDVSAKISEMFQEAKNADRLKRPSGPIADVASQARSINHDLIAKNLSPQELALYERSLEDYGALTQIHEFVKRRGSVEAGGRLGPGSGISRMAVQKFLDNVGYRTEAKIASKLSDFIRKNPEVASRPKELFRSYIDQAAEAVDEMGDEVHH